MQVVLRKIDVAEWKRNGRFEIKECLEHVDRKKIRRHIGRK